MIKKFIAGLMVMGFGAPVMADERLNPAAHMQLLQTVESLGVQVHIDHKTYCGNYQGAYGSEAGMFIVCRESEKTRQTEWTAEDLDTIRHEAHHVLQDCLNGKLGDGEFNNAFDPVQLRSFVERTIGFETASNIVDAYRANNVPDEGLLMEVEAFAVASAIDPSMIENKIEEFCEV